MKVWSSYYENRFGWFRLFGRGLKFKDTTIHDLTFSEKLGKKRGIQIGKWRIGYLPKPLTVQQMHKKMRKGLDKLSDPNNPHHFANAYPEEWNKAVNEAQDKLLQKYIDDKTIEQ